MATKRTRSSTSPTPELTPPSSAGTSSPSPTKLPEQDGFDVDQFKKSKDNEKLVDFVKNGYTAALQARQTKQIQWWQNLTMFYGNHYAKRLRTNAGTASAGLDGKLTSARGNASTAYRKTINRTRSFVRAEHSKFLSNIPDAMAVPATADDQDIRAAFAAEQVWQSVSDVKKLRRHYTRAMWWDIITGNGFLKTWWDTTCADPNTGQQGDINYGSITPFHLFIPDLREQEIEDQPYIIIAYNKTVEWCKAYYGEALKGVDLQANQTSASSILEEGYLNLATTGKKPDSVTVYEAWIKPGATQLLPNGGCVIIVDQTIISMTGDGMPYQHGEYPITKFEHIPTSTFYADSPLVDTNQLQREFNEVRSEIGYAAKTMGKPALVSQKGAIVASKITNEAGIVIEYRAGYQPPTPIALSPLPQYVVDQQDRILQDWEDITGQHDVSRGQAPAGVTAGTAINFLQEKDDQFLTPQYQSIEDGYEKIAGQTLQLFNQYVDVPRKIRTVGADGAFDTMELQGADIKNGLDIRIQRGSSVGQSQAAKEAKVMDMFQIGLIDQPTALKLLEVGGIQKTLDIMNVAERKAQRENTIMKKLDDATIQQAQDQWLQSLGFPPGFNPQNPDPQMLAMFPQIQQMMADPDLQAELVKGPPLVVPVDDFDVHDVHIDTHDKFRMGQEYSLLSQPVKDQLARHVAAHLEAMVGSQVAGVSAAAGEADQSMGGVPDDSQQPDPAQQAGEPPQQDATMAPTGGAQDASLTTGAPQ